MAEATADEDTDEEKGSSPIMAVVFILVAALLAGGVGFGVGKTMFAPMIGNGGNAPAAEMADAAPADEMPDAGAADDTHGASDEGHGAMGEMALRGLDFTKLEVLELDPITTNIGVPSDVWVRMELSLAIKPGEEEEEAIDPVMIEAIHADFLAYMRTTRLQSLAMPSGFQHMVTDLESRAALLSGGMVKRVFVKALLLE